MEPIQLPPVHRNQGGKSLDEGPKGGVLKEQIVKKLEALNKQQTDWLQAEEMNSIHGQVCGFGQFVWIEGI